MREATPELERIVEFCQLILNASTPHAVEAILDEVPDILRTEAGYSEEEIDYFMTQLSTTLTLIENEELAFNEQGQLVPGPNAPQETLESGSLQPAPEASPYTNTVVGGSAIGLSFALLIACAAARKKINKKSHGRTM